MTEKVRDAPAKAKLSKVALVPPGSPCKVTAWNTVFGGTCLTFFGAILRNVEVLGG